MAISKKKLIKAVIFSNGFEEVVMIKPSDEEFKHKENTYIIDLKAIKYNRKTEERKLYYIAGLSLPIVETIERKNISAKGLKLIGEDLPRLVKDVMKEDVTMEKMLSWGATILMILLQIWILWELHGRVGSDLI